MFVVVGGTGNTGSAAAAALLAAGKKVRALVRDPARAEHLARQGVELVIGDTEDAASLARAFADAEGAYALVPPNMMHPDPIALAESVARATREAARAAGLPRLVFLSSEAAHLPSGTGPIRGTHLAEGILAGAAPKLTFLRASFFQENWRPVFGLAAEQGIMPSMLADLAAKRPMVAAADIGRMAATLLMDASPPALVELGGPELYAANDAAAAMAAALGRPVRPVQPPRDSWVAMLTGAGLGQAYADLIVEMYDGINTGHVRFSGLGEQRRGRTGLAETIAGWRAAR